ncbi:MAG TPA: diacylglycerol kinase family protein [Herpetosiphonaceae bacterium]
MAVYRRILVIINPASGRHDVGQTRQLIEERCAREQVAYELRETQDAGDAFMWAQQAEADGFDLVLVSGGDGTIMEAMSGLIKSGAHVPLAQIPVGTANLLARAVNIPTDPQQALDTAFIGKAQRFDVGYLPNEDRYFALVAGAGYDARLIADASRELKNVLGFAAYVVTGIKHLFTLRRARIDLEVDGKRRRLRAHTIMVVNVGEIESFGLALGPNIQPHDGKLDLVIVSSATLWGALQILLRILTRRFTGHSALTYLSASRVKITARPPLPTEIDGEELGTTPLYVEAVPQGALLIVPKDYQPAKEAKETAA